MEALCLSSTPYFAFLAPKTDCAMALAPAAKELKAKRLAKIEISGSIPSTIALK